MNYMSAQTIMDNQNKYRYPVLIGNVNEERIGYDLVQKHSEETKTPDTEMKTKYNLINASQPTELAQRDKNMFTNICEKSKGQQAQVLFGHGFTNEDYLKRDFKTTNELAFGAKMKPQQFISSKYYPEQTSHPLTFYTSRETNLAETIHNEVEAKQPDKKQYKHYDEFTKKFDATFMKTGLRK